MLQFHVFQGGLLLPPEALPILIWIAFCVYADDAEARGSIKGRMN
ncbi:MAG: hypothetical protein RMY64_22730 [Nostoc sp. DedQUE08]|nr:MULTISPECIES: hypothetical protein [unclassified Nostoc]MDZ8033154.1 hypothetical protein [Nostoc sp. DedSLP04]MDZ8068408.1 hypothetical protein [Nostoc sp. DedQUE08]